MVVCKCRKATKLYCFVHKLPVCLECICSDDHRLCVVRTYSEWVIDGDYDWPPTCPVCEASLEELSRPTTRLSCLHVLHTECLQKHLEIFPSYTAPAGFSCPACQASVWPPKNPKDASTTLGARIREVISKSPVGQTILGLDGTSSTATKHEPPPSAFSSPPLSQPQLVADAGTTADVWSGVRAVASPSIYSNGESTRGQDSSSVNEGTGANDGEEGWFGGRHDVVGSLDAVAAAAAETEKAAASVSATTPGGKSALPNSSASAGPSSWIAPQQVAPVSRKIPARGEKMALDLGEDDGHDADRSEMKYVRRGTWYGRILQQFSSPSKAGLPVAVIRKDSGNAEEMMLTGEGRRSRKSRRSGVDPRRILLALAISSCMATMMLLYYRLSQGGYGAGEDPEPTV